MPKVLVVTGSPNDFVVMDHAVETLASFGVSSQKLSASAHRQPAKLHAALDTFVADGGQVVIAAAGMAAHIAGVVASQVTLPVLAVPLPGGIADGLDALLSMVQMPRGVPVATFAVGKHGAINAALFAVQVLALSDPELVRALVEHKRRLAED